ncbi:peptidase M28 [Niastella koreensis]|uniref:Carboxypeptidase Q n=2 Tax=Niastella koreensis TaxID=354356 RepID=G8TQH6_NIAKG|nr:M20/M25/M40 family metallo-hydrolase [Niastella koreensis]AEW03223.1 peptidase M28 [Niastella koreensis GR20-10]OQP55520.1 peptidase M28 [Niastella koreensis]
MRLKLFTLVLTILAFNARAQNEDSLKIRAIADEILLHSSAYENLRVLTKQVGGRLSGSPQTYKAEAWGHKALEKAGADRVLEQPCLVPHWVRGGKDLLVLPGWSTHILDVLALGNSVGTGPKGISAPVILVNSFEELEKKKDQVKGKIVFYNIKFNDTYIKTFEAYRDAVVYRGAGPSQAAKYGAVGVLIRSMSHAADNNPHTGTTRYNDSFPKIPAAAMGLQDADKLAAYLVKASELVPEVRVNLTTNGKMLPDTVAHNIIGEITGSEFPDQIITIGGHLDSWDPAEGAHDDGSGCVHSIEVLRALKAIGYKPKRTIRVVLFANEENGTRGGLKYAEEAKLKKEKHIFALESDEGGFTPRGFGVTMPADQLNKLRSWLPLLSPYGISEINNGGGGSDIGPLAKELGTPLAGLQPDSQRYFDIHHARSDVFEAVNKRELELGAVSIAALIYLVDKYGL